MASQLAIHSSSPSSDSASTGDSVRVVIRMEKVRQNLCEQLGARPTDSDVLSWLGTLGFVPATDGNAWTCSQESLRWLADGEIARAEIVNSGADGGADGGTDGSDRPDNGETHSFRSGWRGLGDRVHAAMDRFARTLPRP
jgi:hypothetical protein